MPATEYVPTCQSQLYSHDTPTAAANDRLQCTWQLHGLRPTHLRKHTSLRTLMLCFFADAKFFCGCFRAMLRSEKPPSIVPNPLAIQCTCQRIPGGAELHRVQGLVLTSSTHLMSLEWSLQRI